MATHLTHPDQVLSLTYPEVIFLENTLFDSSQKGMWSIGFVPSDHPSADAFKEAFNRRRDISFCPCQSEVSLRGKQILCFNLGSMTAEKTQRVACAVEEAMGIRRAPPPEGARVTRVTVTLEIKAVTLTLKDDNHKIVNLRPALPVTLKIATDDNRLLPSAVWKTDWEATPENVAALRAALREHLEFRDPGRGDLG